MSFEDADDVPEARSFCSIRRTRKPRPAASRAMPVPLMPPPIMARSKSATDSPLGAGYQIFVAAWFAPFPQTKIRERGAKGERKRDLRALQTAAPGGAG